MAESAGALFVRFLPNVGTNRELAWLRHIAKVGADLFRPAKQNN